MRLMFAMLVAAGIGLAGTAGASAAPANGKAISEAALAGRLIQDVVTRRQKLADCRKQAKEQKVGLFKRISFIRNCMKAK